MLQGDGEEPVADTEERPKGREGSDEQEAYNAEGDEIIGDCVVARGVAYHTQYPRHTVLDSERLSVCLDLCKATITSAIPLVKLLVTTKAPIKPAIMTVTIKITPNTLKELV